MDTKENIDVTVTNEAKFEEIVENQEVPEIDMQAFRQHLSSVGDNDPQPQLGIKELRALKRSHYHDTVKKFDSVFVLQNKKTGMIVEMRGASPLHAAQSIGWRGRHVKILEVKQVLAKKEIEESVTVADVAEMKNVEQETNLA